jgi:hypothetical protein
MLEIIAVILGILGAWFLLPIELAEVFLTFFVLAAAASGIYWVCTGGWEGVAIFALLVSILGSIRVSFEKVRDKLAALLSRPFSTKGRVRARGKLREHYHARPRSV